MQKARAGRRSFVLVLDDAHLLSRGRLRKLVENVLADLPQGSTLGLASRVDPELPVARLRANRALVELHTRDLALTTAEGMALLLGAGLDLNLETAQALVRRTEGWAAALYMAAKSLAKQRDLFEGPAHFSGNDRLLVEYVRDEILSALPSDLAGFAVRSSVFDELSGPVCDAGLAREGSALVLRKLARACPMLFSLDPEHDRFRWHRLLRETLEGELRRVRPDAAAPIHKRASLWYAESRDDERAIRHAVEAHDVTRTGELLWRAIPACLAEGRCGWARTWLERFTQTEIASCAQLALSSAHICLFSGEVAEAQHWALVAEAALEDDPGNTTTGLESGLAVIEAAIAKAGAAAMGTAAARAQELEPRGSAWRPFLCLLRGIAEHLAGDQGEAERLLQEGVDRGAILAPGVAALCLAKRAMLALERKEWDAAVECSEHATDALTRSGLADQPISALVPAAVAAARAHQGEADEAKRELRRAKDLLASLGEFLPWYGAQVRILLAYASLWVADAVGARTLLAEASRLARRVPDATMFEPWFDEAWAYLDTLAEARLSGPSSLTIAVLRILRFLPTHRSFRDIGMQLGVSRNTVKTQAHAIYRKFGAASRSEAVAIAAEAGLLGQ
ncbi:MAG: hypothetical protein JO240_08635 [Solirubrobacterales bacterium]|nr:hypothetical protein [Solirubrobacterales bacterium]